MYAFSRAPQAAPHEELFPAVIDDFDDAREFAAEIVVAPGFELSPTVSGTVTRQSCLEGEAITSGSSPLEIDGVSLLALSSAVPFYRDLSLGASGRDVTALQKAITVLGHPVAETGVIDAETMRAVNALRATAGLPADENFAVRPSESLWLPAPEVIVASCGARLGSSMVAGQPWVTTLAQVASVAFESDPQAVAGDRVARLNDGALSVEVDALMSEPADLARLDDEFGWSDQARQQGVATLMVSVPLSLATPIEAAAFPASAIVAVGGLCVVDERGGAVPVEPIAAAAGVTHVRLERVVESVVLEPGSSVSCD